MALITGDDLIEAGWRPGPRLGEALQRADEYEKRGITDPTYLIKLLRRDLPELAEKLKMRPEPVGFTEAIEATNELDERNIGAVRRCMRQLLCTPVIERGAVMPDACPAGNAPATIPVGGAIAVRNAIIPAAHSADICCSMHASFFTSNKPVAELLDALMASTRFGTGGRKPEEHVAHPVTEEPVWDNPFLRGLRDKAVMHIADQGDGNHFAFLGRMRVEESFIRALEQAGHGELAASLRGKQELLALVTHHGSRGLGAHVYGRGQKAAEAHCRKVAQGIPESAAWLDFSSDEGRDYWDALQYVSRWTKANHESIHARFLNKVGTPSVAAFGNEHNFVWKLGDVFYHGKGATPAWKDEQGRPMLGLIPLNMAAPILMVLGRDNEEYLSFCPHGAGRNLSRTAIARPFRNENGEIDERMVARAIQEATPGLDVRWYYGRPDVSESPIGYKPASQVKEQIARFGLADVIAEIEPLGSIMAGDSGPPPWIKRKQELSPKQLRAIEHRADRRKERRRLHEFGADEDEA